MLRISDGRTKLTIETVSLCLKETDTNSIIATTYITTFLFFSNLNLMQKFFLLKVIRKIFFKHSKSFRWHLGDYEKHNFFHLKGCERKHFNFLRWVACSLKTGLYKLNGCCVRLHAGPQTPAGPTTHHKNTQKSKFLLSQTLNWKKNSVFLNPRDAI